MPDIDIKGSIRFFLTVLGGSWDDSHFVSAVLVEIYAIVDHRADLWGCSWSYISLSLAYLSTKFGNFLLV